MKNRLFLFLGVLLVGIAFTHIGCKAELEIKPLEAEEFPMSRTPVFYIAKNQIYRASIDGGLRFLFYGEDTLTRRRMPRLNYQRTMMAILEGEPATPVIMNLEGQIIDRLPQYTQVTEMAWSPNGESLFIIQTQKGNYSPYEQSFHFWGEPFDIPSAATRFMVRPDVRCDALTFGPDSSVAWGERLDPSWFGRSTKLYYRTKSKFLEDVVSYRYRRVERITFSRDGSEILAAMRFDGSTLDPESLIRFSSDATEIPNARLAGGLDAVIFPEGDGLITSNYTGSNDKRYNYLNRWDYRGIGNSGWAPMTPAYYSHTIEIELK